MQPVALLLLITSLIAALLSGCSASPTNFTESAPGAVRTVIDAEGTEVQVPEVPERIVTLSEPTLDGVLALGVTPVGTVTGRGQSAVPNYLADVAADIPILGSVAQPNFEAIGQAAPDLILVDGTSINNNPPVIEALREIAPVVYTGFAGGDWRLNFELVAEALGMESEGQAVIQAYDDRVAELREDLGEYEGSTFSIVRWQGGSAALILNELPPGVALLDLGLARPENQDRIGRGHSEPVSLENLQEIDADYIFFGTLGGSSVDNPNAGGSADISGAEDALENAVSTPGFTSLNAYQNDNIILVDGSSWTSTGGPILMNSLIEDVAEALL
ncbi:iron-siderophore ABC transporter substrate-binding protein [Gulosibacter chungangensis]|uniref:Iron-siderophore ABC transporter substrate-binding protein n=1 Tax=Gulosibacter chungangensis TaxID=979746 RepID=A0A7J5BCV2_9MICO|nr:iron-siderophore ABC transporter substrate-binding protein [Gulosibacter chungangensis]